MGTPDFAEESLRKLFNSKHEIVGVVTNPDRAKGRGMKLNFSEVKKFAIENNIEIILQPEMIKNNDEFIENIRKINPDIICVVAYGKILPKEILEIPKYGCVNLHGSLLPKYRGSAPIQWSVLNGDRVTGVTTIYMNEKMDEGDIILKEEVEIGEYETTGELWDRLAKIGANLLLKTVNEIENGTAKREKQGNYFTTAPMLNREISKINWNNEAFKIKNLVYGLNPFMGAYTMYEEKKIKLWKVKIIEKRSEYAPGYIVDANEKTGLEIATKDKNILVEEIQGENSKKMNIGDFLRGNRIETGKILK
jgi:methionyl-tRNA formyltransferase